MSAIPKPRADERSWLGFVLAGQRYAVSLACVREVIRCGDVTPVPGAPFEVLGIVNLRGQIVAVLDGRRRFGLSGTEQAGMAESERIVVFDDGGTVIGMKMPSVTCLSWTWPISRRRRRDAPTGAAIRSAGW
jgi:purine-binding chemotaxis protein CheW